MRKAIIIILCCLWGNSIHAQKKPFSKMNEHLLKSGEISKLEASDTSNVFCSPIKSNDSVAIFSFGSRSTHSYFFLLLKNASEWKILNCYSLDTDWNDLRKAFAALGSELSVSDVIAICNFYEMNKQVKTAPPMPIFKNGKFAGTRKLPRKIIPTSPFLFNQ